MCTTQKLNLARVQKWLEANNNTIVDAPDEADTILCMTCNGWSLLEELSYERIRKYKKKYNDKMIVMGCVNDAHPKKVSKIYNGPTIKTNSNSSLSFEEIESLFPAFETSLLDIPAQSVFRRKEDYRDYNLSKKFINIAEGCAFHCTFCTHKPGLGKRRSRTINDILNQVKACVEEDVKIINLMGMETSMYGIDVGSSYPTLLREILAYSDCYEIHVAQFQPMGIYRYYDELLALFKNKRVSDIQVPIQSVSARIMKMMNRREFSAQTGPFMKEVRAANARAVLRTDLIVGWPTETREERYASLDFAGQHFDEIAAYTIELSPDLPAWKYQGEAFTTKQLEEIRLESADYLKTHYDVIVHSGQQEDNTMETIEEKRIRLRQSKSEHI